MRPLLAAVLALAVTAPAAAASFPGANGLFAVTEDSCDGSIERPHLQAYTADGRRAHALTPRCDRSGDRASPTTRETFAPDWSPDGSRLLYGQSGGGDEPARYETVAADGTDPRPATPALAGLSYASGASYAPDGRRFAYLAGEGLMVAPGDGGAAAALRDAPNFFAVRWSPDGRRMAVVRDSGATHPGLWILAAASGRLLRRVARGRLVSADWSPDGRRLVFSTTYGHDDRTGDITGANLYVVRADGTRRPRRFVRTRGVLAANPVWSPDGRSIAWIQMDYTPGDVAFRASASLWRKPVAGGRARRVATLPPPNVEEGFHTIPDLAWQPRPRAR